MSEEQLKAFLEKVKADTSLQEQLEAAAADSDAVLAIAKEAGFSISIEDLKMAQSEITDEELEDAAGGTLTNNKTDTVKGAGRSCDFRRGSCWVECGWRPANM